MIVCMMIEKRGMYSAAKRDFYSFSSVDEMKERLLYARRNYDGMDSLIDRLTVIQMYSNYSVLNTFF